LVGFKSRFWENLPDDSEASTTNANGSTATTNA
jgi:hypothetical protein